MLHALICKTHKFFSAALWALCVALGTGPFAEVRAELPPSAYEKMQAEAPEVLRIKVLRVESTPAPDDATAQEVAVVAQVLKVGRTRTDLKPDDLITLKYRIVQHPKEWVGPGQVPLLQEDAEPLAYLKRLEDSTDYAPAAGVMSFSRFIE